MKFKCDPKELNKALEITSKALNEKSKIIGFEGVRLSTENNNVVVTAASGEMYIEKKINANILVDGITFIKPMELKNLLNQLREMESIEVEKIGNELFVYYGHSTGSYAVSMGVDEAIPSIDFDKKGDEFVIKEGDLKDAIEKTAFCVSIEENRKALKGLFFDIKDKILTLVAIDGARVAIAKKDIVTDIDTASFLIPGKIIDDISKIFEKASNDPIKISIYRNYIVINRDNTNIVINLIDEKFLDYQKFTQIGAQTVVVVDKKEMSIVLNRVFTVSQKALQNYISIEAKDDMFKINSKTSESSIDDYVPVKIEGKEILIGFNSKYLKESIDRINEDFFKIEFNGPMSPISIKPISGDDYVYVLMPLKVMKQN